MFLFSVSLPPKNIGDLSHRASQRNKGKRKLVCLSYLSPCEWLLYDRECFVFVFVLGLKVKNSQFSMALSSGELENI